MTNEPAIHLHPSLPGNQSAEFTVYHWVNPETDCDCPYLAVNTDRSIFLSMGGHSICFEFELPRDAELWLTKDFAPTGEHFQLNLAAVCTIIEQAFPGGALFGIVHFAENLTVCGMEMSLWRQKTAEGGPEYRIQAPGEYERWYRQLDVYTQVADSERVMLDLCCATFAPFAVTFPHFLTELTTPRYMARSLELDV